MAAYPETAAAQRSVPEWRQRLGVFWRWWSGELVQLMPERFAALRGAGRVPILALEGNDVILVEPRQADPRQARVALDALDAAGRRQAVRSLLERAGETRARARACLGAHEALTRKVTMPAATEENLGDVLAFEMDRLTPFRAEDVYYDYHVVGRDAAAATISVLVAVARREVVDARVEAMRALGLSVQGVAVRDDPAGLDLLPSEQRGERESAQERTVRRALLAATIVLLIAALSIPWLVKRQRALELLPQVARAEAEAKTTDRLAKDLERQVADYNFLLEKRHTTPPALAYIEEVTRLLPDNTWVQQLDIKTSGKTREVQVTGETSSSSRLIEILEQSTLLSNAEPRGTVTRGSQPGTERFMIAAKAKSRPAPEARALSELVNVPPPQPTAPPRVEAPRADAEKGEAPKADARPEPAKLEPTTGRAAGRAAPVPAPVTPDGKGVRPATPGK